MNLRSVSMAESFPETLLKIELSIPQEYMAVNTIFVVIITKKKVQKHYMFDKNKTNSLISEKICDMM